jgi:S1-C subfamily serine protease
MASGGMVLEDLEAPDRTKAGVTSDGMALRVKYLGEYGPHAAAKQAGFRVGDVLIDFDGRTDLMRETDLLAHALAVHRPGERVTATVLRHGTRLSLELPMQD